MTALRKVQAAWLQETLTSLPSVIEARRAQIHIRTGICIAIAISFHSMSGLLTAIWWSTSYICLQILELALFRKVGSSTVLGSVTSSAFVSMLILSNIVFTLFGVALYVHSGLSGLVCTGLLWSGSIINGAMASGESKTALIAATGPPILAFLTLPLFIVACGGTQSAGMLIALAGLLNFATVLLLWSRTRRLLLTTTCAKETARLALLDPETGLPNRNALMFRIQSMPQNSNSMVFVAAISLDRFDSLANAIGHVLTVELIREVMVRLSSACPDLSFARLSTSMLGTVWTAGDADEARRKMLPLLQAMKGPIVLQGTPVDVSVTIGLSKAGDQSGASKIAIIDRAVIAVDQGHHAHQPVFHFDAELLGDPVSALSLMGEMLEALDRDTMDVHYQPKEDLRTGKIIGVEALVRWRHPDRGSLPPDSFLPMAEETGHVAALTEWVLRRAIRDQRQLAERGYPLSFSINLSGCLLDDEGFAETLLAIASQAAGKIIFEVTETSVIGNAKIACRTLAAFRAAGIGISIDDYGTGMSSLGYLKTIPADELKIDKIFVFGMANDNIDAIIVRSAIDLAHSLGLIVVAEGVETKGALDLLIAINCDLVQGYFIAKPIPLAGIETMLQARREAFAQLQPALPSVPTLAA